ncbi:hypothetical protein EVU96_13955 [Bacillus infantis]|uniref:hypothetical protein n=1 Tax=Bacillus infantis TaxID=324767 RepID=UPI00101CAFEA|nr:hypothetical protein [Bacillus infantis]RYI28280.1 hypothetical protein EVU96_13955 [Bacillus infantis]
MKKLDNKDIKIEGISLPEAIQIGIDNRNDDGTNHIFENEEVKVLCSKCKQYHPVFRIDNRQWKDINKTYWVSKTRGTKELYFGSKCIKCYEEGKKKSKKVKKEIEPLPIMEEATKQIGEYVAWSKKNDGVQQSIFLIPELDLYLRLYGIINKTKKNELINQIIAKFKEEHPINL